MRYKKGDNNMNQTLAFIMEQLNQISVRGYDVERVAAAKKAVMQIQNALLEAKNKEAKKNETKTE